jgi:formate hydrogenlyase subunit 6/NADH:ubiquinone oxidoreductase subunit I
MSVRKISGIILKSLFSKPSTEGYPYKKRSFYRNTRGSIKNNIDACIFCGICGKKCPTKAIAVKRDEKLWAIDRFSCIACGACVAACPKKCLDMENAYCPPAIKKSVDRFTQESTRE